MPSACKLRGISEKRPPFTKTAKSRPPGVLKRLNGMPPAMMVIGYLQSVLIEGERRTD